MREYDPNEVIVSVGGSDIEGFAPGSFVKIAMDSDAFNMVVGSRGDVARSKTSNRTGKITISLMQTSPSNDLLSTIHNLDLLKPNGAGVFSVAVRDSSTGRAIYGAVSAWIPKFPDSSFDAQDTPREWVIQCERLEQFIAGV
jgi:hypothetical protein